MTCTDGFSKTTVRTLALVLAGSLFAGCGGANHLVPTAALPGAGAVDAYAATTAAKSKREHIKVRMQIRIPHRGRGAHTVRHPATISALTNSIGIAIDGGGQHVYNTTPASPNCVAGAAGLVCTISVAASVGTDTFVVTTYSGINGGGTVLDQGTATVPIARGKANAVAVSLGPVVSTTADSGVGSLRYAIASAGSGDTIVFLLPVGSTITLMSPIMIVGTVSLAGPGASSVAISGGNAHQIFAITGKATISGLTLNHGMAAIGNAPGGAIGNLGTLTLANDTIGASTSVVNLKHHARERYTPAFRRHPHCATTYAYGGAVYNDGSLTSSGTTYNGNVVMSNTVSCISGEGGAIYNDQGGSISSTGDTFTNNSAMAGGAVFNDGIGQAAFTNDTFTANTGCNATSGCPTTGCTSAGCTTYAQGVGAAIFDEGIGVTIVSSTLTNNVAGGASLGSHGEGGALALVGGAPTVTNSVFTGNLAGGGSASCSTGGGGAIVAAVPLVVNGDTFTNNVASGDGSSGGGAIFATMDLQGSGDIFKGNSDVASGSTCTPNGMGIGGAAYGMQSVTFTNSTFADNVASGNAGGGGGALACATCFLTGDTFTSNSAIGTGAAGATTVAASGGGFFGGTLAKVSDCTFTSNSATADGVHAQGAIGGAGVMTGAGSFVSSHNTFASNTVTEAAGTGIAGGGGVATGTGAFSSSGDIFQSNVVSGLAIAAGGGAFLEGGYVMSGATFSANRVTGAQGAGGGLAVSAAGDLSNSTFTGNGAGSTGTGIGGGGAFYDSKGATISNSTFSGNAASNAGGGILATGGLETITNSKITGNEVPAAKTSPAGGGGIFDESGIILEGSTVSNNAVTVGGTGLVGGGGILNGGGLELLQSTISGNTVLGTDPASGGGGIYNGAGAVLTDATISGNRTSVNGGGIDIVSASSVSLVNVTLFKNAATGIGGNIDNPFAMTLTNSIVAGGTAATGADIDNTGTLKSGGYNIIQTAVVGTALTGTTTGNLTADPLLLGLSSNGGATFTNADQATSPGRAHIPYSGSNCGTQNVPVDQRGYLRGAGGRCDVGAFEYAGVPTAARHRLPQHASMLAVLRGPHLRPLRLHLLHFPPLHFPMFKGALDL